MSHPTRTGVVVSLPAHGRLGYVRDDLTGDEYVFEPARCVDQRDHVAVVERARVHFNVLGHGEVTRVWPEGDAGHPVA